MTDPSPSGDEELLAALATGLADALEAALPAWVTRCVVTACERSGTVVDDSVLGAAAVAGTACARRVGPQLRDLLATDIDDQSSNPLSIVRSAVSFPTRVLREAGVPPAERDAFAERAFPDDPYGLAPATFADVGEAVAEPGLLWGAAKAHVHLARRSIPRREGPLT